MWPAECPVFFCGGSFEGFLGVLFCRGVFPASSSRCRVNKGECEGLVTGVAPVAGRCYVYFTPTEKGCEMTG